MAAFFIMNFKVSVSIYPTNLTTMKIKYDDMN